ncbi:hypothetical protein JOB18_017503 [Solea senegalensis]|uniref:TIR domain-containing protein n=2 Tax=Solea senegalensis TaxID=28829 RepID=A0AAV6SYZ4_SOLSE|nr:hypothetical protein JOB18_017503 [Solea senegalensis]
MSECIQESQKVLLVLSPEFVRSRWCLLEANMSLFRDCLERKPIVPVLLQPGVSVPLHLCHLTYLEANDPDLMNKLLKVLCTPNKQLQGSTVVPFQPPSIYNGKALQPLTAVNDEELNAWDSGWFSDMEVPEQLRLVIEDQERYKKAVQMINNVSQNWLRPLWLRVLLGIAGVIAFLVLVASCIFTTAVINSEFLFKPKKGPTELWCLSLIVLFIVPFGLLIHLSLWKNVDSKYIVREMQKAVGQANTALSKEKVLIGCQSNSKLYLVYVSLEGCKQEVAKTFSDEDGNADDMFQRALIFFSSGYACSLAKRHFPFPQPSSTGHLEGGVCFCQYVSQQLSRGEWT